MNKVCIRVCTRRLCLLMTRPVIAADPDNDDAKRGLAEVYEILGETRKALNLVNQGALPRNPLSFSLIVE